MSDTQHYPGNPYQNPVPLRKSLPPRQTDTQRARPRFPRLEQEDENPDAWTLPKPHTSTVTYGGYHSPRTRTQDVGNPRRTRRVQQERRFDKYTLIILGSLLIIVMVGGWFVFTKVQDAWTSLHDNLVYGTPFRTFQADQYMNLGDSPQHPDHFIALNLHGVIEIIQINPLDSKQDTSYVLAHVDNESTPASLSFRDTTGDGHTDVIVTIGDSTPYSIVLLNNGKTLVPTQPAH